ncbi:WESB_1763 family membrane protein [uncultured Brachyspira sp.]|uniref:WESB_1763 family membrane protein n=2 Tax=uncultured Brachyspira sp. TaxID=221953 RepID=UPI0025FDD29D|nr:WESB_1763 family membrane protein [uncultured Brachyspira sp.]
MTQINKNISFVGTYSFWSYILIAIVFINYLFFRAIVIDNSSFIYLITVILDYSILISFFLLVFYKFYNCIFNLELSTAVSGIAFLIFGILKLYAMEINIHNIIELLYFISIFILTIKILISMIISKNTIELERGVYIFILVSLLSSNANYILISANKIIDTNAFHYISSFISAYMNKLSSFSFLILIIAYILFFIKKIIMKNINKSFYLAIAAVVLSVITIVISGNSFFLIIMSFYNALGVTMYLPFTIYMVIIIMFSITLFTSFTASILLKSYYPKLIIFTMFILSGLDINNFSLRLISVFSLMEMLAVYNDEKYDS